jgi:hypothetical protein
MKRPRKPKPAPVYEPNACICVNVDPGECSGYALTAIGQLEDFGECDVFAGGPQRVLEKALEIAKAFELPCVLVIERPFHRRIESGGYNTTATGTADKIWREMAKRLGFGKKVCRVYPSSWRARVLGGKWHMAKRDAVRAEEMRVASAYVLSLGMTKQVGADSAAAILIGQWSKHSGEVAACLPRPRVRKAG